MIASAAIKIEKEFITNYTFTDGQSNISAEQQKQNSKKLFRAMLLGNGFHNKVKILFTTTQGLRMVETTVWAYTERFVMLKGGVFIPVESVVEVVLD